MEKQTEIKVPSEVLTFSTENDLLNNSMIEIESTENGKVNLDGKNYTKVSTRLQVLRRNLGFNIRVKTELLHIDEKLVVAKAEIYIFREGEWFEVSTGHAEEKRDLSEINKFSAVENAETSAIGRALAALGLSGDEYASIDEVINAKAQKEAAENTSSTSNVSKVSSSVLSFISKLLKDTNTETEKFLSHYGVKRIGDLTEIQGQEAIHLLNKKKKTNSQKSAIEQSKKEEQAEALSVLEENKEKSTVTFKKVNIDEDSEELAERVVAAPLEKVSEIKEEVVSDKQNEDNKSSKVEEVQEETKTDTEQEASKEQETIEESKEAPVKTTRGRGRKKATSTTTKKTTTTRGRGRKKVAEKVEPKEPEVKPDDLNEDDDIVL